MTIEKYILFFIMLIHCITDMKYKKVSMGLTIVGMGVGIISWILDVGKGCFAYEQCLALLLGVFCLLMGKITREAIGYGDGMIVFMLGFFYEWQYLCIIGMNACLLAAIVALICLVIFHKSRNYELPFVPFLTVAICLREIGI